MSTRTKRFIGYVGIGIFGTTYDFGKDNEWSWWALILILAGLWYFVFFTNDMSEKIGRKSVEEDLKQTYTWREENDGETWFKVI